MGKDDPLFPERNGLIGMVAVSDDLLRLVRGAKRELVLAAPFVKLHSLKHLLDCRPDGISVACFTRWLPGDIAASVCDLEIYDYLIAISASLFISPALHAKYYRADDDCLVGSANITHPALGLSFPPNLELLVKISHSHGDLAEWEDRLKRSAIPATEELRDQIKSEAERLIAEPPMKNQGSVDSKVMEIWLPTCPSPQHLWDVYAGTDEDVLVRSAAQACRDDLNVLSPPLGLDKSSFVKYVASTLLLVPLVLKIDSMARSGLRDSEAVSFLVANGVAMDQKSAAKRWRILKEWMSYFYPNTYVKSVQEETILRGKKISS